MHPTKPSLVTPTFAVPPCVLHLCLRFPLPTARGIPRWGRGHPHQRVCVKSGVASG